MNAHIYLLELLLILPFFSSFMNKTHIYILEHLWILPFFFSVMNGNAYIFFRTSFDFTYFSSEAIFRLLVLWLQTEYQRNKKWVKSNLFWNNRIKILKFNEWEWVFSFKHDAIFIDRMRFALFVGYHSYTENENHFGFNLGGWRRAIKSQRKLCCLDASIVKCCISLTQYTRFYSNAFKKGRHFNRLLWHIIFHLVKLKVCVNYHTEWSYWIFFLLLCDKLYAFSKNDVTFTNKSIKL